jgi:hypothetical protein
MAGDRPQPEPRSGQEVLGRDEDQRTRVVDREEKTADQAHVVVEGQPRNAELREAALGWEEHLERLELRHQVGVREGNRLRVGGRARRELNQAEGIGLHLGLELTGAVPAHVIRSQAAQSREGPLDRLTEEPAGSGVRQHEARAGRTDHPGGRGVVLGQPAQAERGIERNRDRAGEQHPEVGVEKGGGGREDEGDPVPGCDAQPP